MAWYDGQPPPEKEAPMFGENNDWSESATGPINCTQVTGRWYSEGQSWDYDNSQVDASNAHFAQVVWKASRRFGCGQALSRGPRGGVHTVCYYDPTIVAGEERANVLKPKE